MVGVVVVIADVFDGVDEHGTDGEGPAAPGVVMLFLAGDGAELFHAFDEADGFAFFDLLPEPVLVVGARPAGQRLAAIVLGDGSALGETGPDEGIGVAGLETKVGDFAVGGLGEEPLDEGRELPAVLNLEVDFVAQDGGQGGNCALRSDAGGALAFRARTYVLGSGGGGLFHCFVSMLAVDDCFYGRKSSPRPEKA